MRRLAPALPAAELRHLDEQASGCREHVPDRLAARIRRPPALSQIARHAALARAEREARRAGI